MKNKGSLLKVKIYLTNLTNMVYNKKSPFPFQSITNQPRFTYRTPTAHPRIPRYRLYTVAHSNYKH